MDLNDVTQKRARLEQEAYAKIQDAVQEFRGDLNKSNEEVKQKLQEMNDKVKTEQNPEVEGSPPPPPPQPQKPQPQKPVKQPLIYFSYPMSGYSEQPSWVEPLRQVLVQAGYLVYNPWDNINAQFGQQDIGSLNSLPVRLVKSLCSILQIPEEVLLPFDAVWKIIEQGDNNDNFGVVFQCLWFLTRSSLVICDLIRPMAGAGTAQEMLYSKQLNLPVIGLLPTSGQLNPFVQRTTTVLFNSSDLLALLPAIKGYAPITSP